MMKHSRLTITIPDYMHAKLKTLVNPGEVSSFISEAIEEKIGKVQRNMYESSVERMLKVSEKMEKYTTEEIDKAIHKGRP